MSRRGKRGGATMATEQFLRRQAATCAALAKETYDQESRQRCLRLEETYLHLAEIEAQLDGRFSVLTGENEIKPTA